MRRALQILFFKVLFICLCFPAFTQDYIANVQFFGIEEGLSHREVYCSYEDDQGFIWLGTKYGLNRFDGYDFKLYTKEINGLASNEIHQVFQDGEGWLWLITILNPYGSTEVEQVSLLNPKTGEVRTLEDHFGENVPFKASDIEHVAIIEGRKTILLGTKDGRIIIYEKGKPLKIVVQKEWKKMMAWQHATDHTFLVQSDGGNVPSSMYEMTFGGEILQSWQTGYMAYAGFAPPNTILAYRRPILTDTDLSMNLVTFQSKSKFKPYSLHPSLDPLICDDWSCKIYYKETGSSFWYKSEERFFVFDPKKGVLFDFNTAFPNISKSVIRDIYFDKTGRGWVSTSQGLYIIQLAENPFQRFLYNPSSAYDINNYISCRGILEHQGVLWLGTEEQRNFKIDLSTSREEVLPYLEAAGAKGQKTSSEGRVIIQEGKDHLLLGDNDLFHYQISNGSYQSYRWEAGSYSSIWSLYKDQHETVWAGTYYGPLGFWKQGMDSIRVYKLWNGYELPATGYIYTFLDMDKDNLLVGTTSGIYQLNHQKGIINRYWTGGSGGDYLPHDQIYHLTKDKEEEDVIWIATDGGGLIRAEIAGQKEQSNNQQLTINNYQQFTIANGLSNNTIYAVYEDDAGNLWLPSDYGIIQFDKNTHFTKAYLEKDGISNKEFNRTSHHQDEQGNLYFGGLNGITTFHPTDLTAIDDTLNIPLRVTSVQQYDGETNKMVDKTVEFSLHPSITLQPNDRFFQLDFSLLEYQDAAQIRYAYKIEGQDADWNITKDNHLRISGLPYGELTLRVKGQSVNGQFSADELAIPITVLRPFYATWWFRGFWALVVLIGGPVFYKWRVSLLKKQQVELESEVENRTKTIQKQSKELKEMDQLKSRFFANVSHELRTPLTLMLGPTGSVMKQGYLKEKDKELLQYVYKNEKHLLGLVNEILDLSKLETNRLEVKESLVGFYEYLSPLVAQFKSVGDSKKVVLSFTYHARKDLRLYLDERKFEKIINNFLSNALKFTPNTGTVKLAVSEEGGNILIKVKDTGAGIHPDDLPHIFERFFQSKQVDAPVQGGTGIGLSLCKELAELLGGRVGAESEFGKGSIFYFEFPKKEVTEESLLTEADGQPTPTLTVADIKEGADLPEFGEALISTASSEYLPPDVDGGKSTILVIEDNMELRSYLRIILEDRYRVLTAENGKIGLDKLTAHPVDLIVSDLMMPIMDGFQLLEKVKSQDQWKYLPFIMLTARADVKVRLRALRIGVDDYMVKPFEEEELLARVENLLKNSYRRRLYQKELAESEGTGSTDSENEMTPSSKLRPEELHWLEELETVVQKELTHFHFNVDVLANKMALSKRQLERKAKQLTGLSPSKYIQEVRFHEARQMLENKSQPSIKAVVYSVGVKDTVHFSRLFRARFGKSPSEYFHQS